MTDFYQVKDRAYTTLASGLTDSALVAVYTSGGALASGNCILTCENEKINQTARSGNWATISRGFGGTTAAAHAIGVPIALNVTAGVVGQLQSGVVALETVSGISVASGFVAATYATSGTAATFPTSGFAAATYATSGVVSALQAVSGAVNVGNLSGDVYNLKAVSGTVYVHVATHLSGGVDYLSGLAPAGCISIFVASSTATAAEKALATPTYTCDGVIHA
jgi:hypothetical protein